MINIAEILKDCPKGMELDCTDYSGEVTFEQVIDSDMYPIKIRVKYGNECFKNALTEYGQTCKTTYNKCVIFPKGKTTWEGFQKPFKDGDVVINDRGNIFIYKGLLYNDKNRVDFYCGYLTDERAFVIKESKDSNFGSIDSLRLATEEEKQKLFDIIEREKLFYAMEKEKQFYAIKDNGYQGDSKTKTLYKPEFKDGDVCTGKVNGNLVIFIYKERVNTTLIKSHFTLVGACKNCYIYLKDEEIRFATEEEKQELFKAIQDNGYRWDDETKTLRVVGKLGKLKFKVGDVVQDKDGNKVKITEVVHECGCYLYKTKIANEIGKIYFDEQNDWELVPDKFDITTLKPFDKVLVRDENGQKWMCDIFSYYDDKNPRYPFWGVGRSNSKQCIPYEENKHLLGTTNDCDEFYKNW